MTRFMLTTAAAAALAASTAFANTQLEEQVDTAFDASGIMVDTAKLNDEQLNELFLITSSTDDHGEKRNKVRAVMEDAGYASMNVGPNIVFVPINSLKAQVQNGVEDYGYEVDVNALNERELAELYIAISSETQDEARAAIESVLQ